MTLNDIESFDVPNEILVAWCFFEAYRRYGIRSENIWFYPDSDQILKMAIKENDKIVFVADCIKMTLPKEKLIEIWTMFSTSLLNNEISEDFLSSIWDKFMIKTGIGEDLYIALAKKGIKYAKK